VLLFVLPPLLLELVVLTANDLMIKSLSLVLIGVLSGSKFPDSNANTFLRLL
jgi:hypothetical protein